MKIKTTGEQVRRSGIIIFLGFVLGSFTSSAQYIPIPTDSTAFWKVEWYDYQFCGPIQPNASYRTFFSGDTVINGLDYAKTYFSGYSQCLPMGYMGALRNDSVNRKVYFVEAGSMVEKLLYDFNPNVGDTVPQLYSSYDFIVIGIDSVFIGQGYRKRIQLDGTNFSDLGNYIIEGIGSTNGLLSPLLWPETLYLLRCFSQNNLTIYPDTSTSCFDLFNHVNEEEANLLIIYPNPIETVALIKSNKLMKEIKLIDIDGRIVLDELIGSSIYTFNRSHFLSGFYVCEVVAKDGTVYYRKILLK